MSAEVTSAYCEAPTSGELIQGELLGPIAHVIPQVSLDVDVEVPSGPSRRIRHDLAFVMTSDCDLLSDFLARTAMTSASDLDTHPSALYGVTLVEAHLAANAGALRKEIASGKVMTRLKDNQIERYHYLEACSAIPAVVAPLFIDFRKSFVVP